MSALPSTAAPDRTLTAYAPRLSVEWLRAEPDRPHRRVTGSMAFVDISGFTKLTERLARIGRAGSEELSDILDATFRALLAACEADGGDLIKWGGDAVLLLFEGDEHAARAARAAYRMREALRDVGRVKASAGRVTLRMSVGIHSGEFDLFLVGDPLIHRELVVCGAGATTTAIMESIAEAGQIAVSTDTAALLPHTALGASIDGGRLLRSCPQPSGSTGIASPQDAPDVHTLLPPLVRAHLLESRGSSEHRTVGVAFVKFTDTDELLERLGPDEFARALDDCVRNVQHACETHGVSFQESDIDRNGGKFMLVAGAPRSSDEDEDRILRAVQSIVSHQTTIPLKAGVNRGPVFAGDFGPEFRRTFSIKGDAINVAARVMAHARPGQVLATLAVLSHAKTVFVTDEVPPFMVKGKSLPIRASVVGLPQGVRVHVDDDDDEFIGREDELAFLATCVDDVRAGVGGVVEIVAEPGMGKSRLIDEVRRQSADVPAYQVHSTSYDAHTPYRAFRSLLFGVLALPGHADDDAITQALAQAVQRWCPELEGSVPLLGVVLDVAIPETDQTRDIDERFRRARLEDVFLEFLRAVLMKPTVLAFEDAHLMDEASASLLVRVVTAAPTNPWLVLITRRDLATGFAASGDRIVESVEPYRRIDLQPIDLPHVIELIAATTGDEPLSPHTVATIAEKSGGNPLFLRALVTAVRMHLDSDAELPDSVETVLGAEIDRLAARDRTTLRYAAVLGMTFTTDLLAELNEATGVTGPVALSPLSRFIEGDPDEGWRFRHMLVRDVAYAGLPYKLRRQLHERAGRIIEARTPDPEDVADRLALHFFHAGDFERSWRYSCLAGRRAHARYAYAAAIDFYKRALESARHFEADPHDVAGVLESLGDANDLAGLPTDAVTAYRQAKRILRGDPLSRGGVVLKETGALMRTGAHATSIRLATGGRKELVGVEGAQALAMRSRLATRRAFTHYLMEQYHEALRWSEVGLREARESGDEGAVAFAANTRHVACLYGGVPADEPYGEIALEISERTGDLRLAAYCINNLAIASVQDGDWNGCARQLMRAAELFVRIGDTAGEANARYNLADVLIRQRRFAEALPILATARRAAHVIDDAELVALVIRETGRVEAGIGDLDAAVAHFAEARPMLVRLGLSSEVVGLDGGMAEVLALQGDASVAIGVAEVALAQLSDPDDPLAGQLNRILGDALAATGDIVAARAAYEAAIAAPTRSDGGLERAWSQLRLAALLEQEGADATELKARATATLWDMGVRLD